MSKIFNSNILRLSALLPLRVSFIITFSFMDVEGRETKLLYQVNLKEMRP